MYEEGFKVTERLWSKWERVLRDYGPTVWSVGVGVQGLGAGIRWGKGWSKERHGGEREGVSCR